MTYGHPQSVNSQKSAVSIVGEVWWDTYDEVTGKQFAYRFLHLQ